MQKFKLGLLASVVAIAAGCTQGTPGGPGVRTNSDGTTYSANKPVVREEKIIVRDDVNTPVVKENDSKAVVNDSKETFTLRMPLLSTSLKQGETKVASIAIQRGKDFADDVDLKFEGIPRGVTLDPAAPILKQSEKELKLTVSATEDAALGDFTIHVMGHPAKGGADAMNEFKITVSAK